MTERASTATDAGGPDFPARLAQLRRQLRVLFGAIPDTMGAFDQLHQAALAEGELSAATKEMIALAVAICTHCDGCIAFHVHDALEAGATPKQIREAVGVAVLMGGAPAAVYGSEALTAVRQFEDQRR